MHVILFTGSSGYLCSLSRPAAIGRSSLSAKSRQVFLSISCVSGSLARFDTCLRVLMILSLVARGKTQKMLLFGNVKEDNIFRDIVVAIFVDLWNQAILDSLDALCTSTCDVPNKVWCNLLPSTQHSCRFTVEVWVYMCEVMISTTQYVWQTIYSDDRRFLSNGNHE